MTSNPESAMTEIALAMAIGFFSVMVLTTISMGISDGPAGRLASTAILEKSQEKGAAGGDRLLDEDVLVLFDGRQFLDRRLAPVDPSQVKSAGRVILAVDPKLPMEKALAAKASLAAANTVITTLDGNWRRALNQKAGRQKTGGRK